MGSESSRRSRMVQGKGSFDIGWFTGSFTAPISAAAAPSPAPDQEPVGKGPQREAAAASALVSVTLSELSDRLGDMVSELRTRTGMTDLVAILDAGLNWELGPAQDLFTELSGDGWLAGLGALPCCAHHDRDQIEAFAAGLDRIAAARQAG